MTPIVRKDDGPSFWFHLGIATGSASSLFVLVALRAIVGPSSWTEAWTTLREWQTLLTGIAAVLAAIATISVLRQQINEASASEEDRRMRKDEANRAMLPAALSELVSHYKKTLNTVVQNTPKADPYGIVQQDIDWIRPSDPHIPTGALQTIQRCIENGDTISRTILAEQLRRFQIVHSRTLSFLDELSPKSTMTISQHNANSITLDIVEALLKIEALFPYARGEVEQTPEGVPDHALAQRAFWLNISEETHPGITLQIQSRSVSLAR